MQNLDILTLLAFIVMLVGSASSSRLNYENSTHELVCQQSPIELGLVLDSSSSISHRDFATGIEFLHDLLGLYQIGDGPSDVRVSVITYGHVIYPEDSFNLTTYSTKAEVIHAVDELRHRAGLATATSDAIEYMSTKQLSRSKSRSYADRVGIVITDGNSQRWRATMDAAQAARDSGITMLAVGVGIRVRDDELLHIAGDASRVIHVQTYKQLKSIEQKLARQTCIHQQRLTTPAPTQTAACGVKSPTDLYFLFSPSELGFDAVVWVTSLMETTVKQAELQQGFRYGVISASCPDDGGFDVSDDVTTDDLSRRVNDFISPKLPGLVKQLVDKIHDVTSGTSGMSGTSGPQQHRPVAVIILGKQKAGLEGAVTSLLKAGVEVHIANPLGAPVNIPGANTLGTHHGSHAGHRHRRDRRGAGILSEDHHIATGGRFRRAVGAKALSGELVERLCTGRD